MMIEGNLKVKESGNSDRQALVDRVADLQSDMVIAGDLVELVQHVVGELNMGTEWGRRQQAHACAALIGLEHYLSAVKDRIGAMHDDLKGQ